MAKMRVSGAELELKENLSRDMIRRMVEAGGRVADSRMRAATEDKRHVRNGDMLLAIKPTDYKEWFGGGSTEVYPQGYDRKGVRNATKAYVINYGRGRKKVNGKLGDRFITGDEDATREAVTKAMEAENARMVEEI